jgi:thymidine phosphorylase
LKHFQQFIVNQGGNWSQFTSLSAELKQSFIIYSEQTGYLIYSKLSNIGLALIELGAGRKLKTDFLDALSGIICHYEVYEKVAANTPLFTLFTKLDFTNLTQAIKLIKFAYRIVPNLDFKKNKLILEIM